MGFSLQSFMDELHNIVCGEGDQSSKYMALCDAVQQGRRRSVMKKWKVEPYHGLFRFRILEKKWWGWADRGHYSDWDEAQEIVDKLNDSKGGG